MKKFLILPVLAAMVILAYAQPKPKDGFVPDSATAIKIAVAVWEPIYGADKVAYEKPYRARLLTNAVWKVESSLPPGTNIDRGHMTMNGGVMTALIAKEDGRILEVYHTK